MLTDEPLDSFDKRTRRWLHSIGEATLALSAAG
jgi:hypothetical protein